MSIAAQIPPVVKTVKTLKYLSIQIQKSKLQCQDFIRKAALMTTLLTPTLCSWLLVSEYGK